jgi:putative methionine-R-sulfoxide reductase with GAF domain
MSRTLLALAAFATSATLFAGTSTEAFANSKGYRAVPATAFAAADTVVVRDVLWKCAGSSCVATKATSRPEIVCATAAREIGKLNAFSANGQEFTPEQLAKCNARAR